MATTSVQGRLGSTPAVAARGRSKEISWSAPTLFGFAGQGRAVALSADGNTAIVGGSDDNLHIGAVWIFTRSAGVWTQQGNKLVGTGYVETRVNQGISVALSADGNTAIIGGSDDNSGVGAAWVFTRSGSVWTQQGGKLVGSGAVVVGNVAAAQGISVALSADGNTAMWAGWRQRIRGGSLGLDPHRRDMEPARIQAGRLWCGRSRRTRLFRRAVGRRQYRDDGRV